ncbi:MAG: VOC family protein [Candidatus Bathyarchaeia archaeon]|nr:VOC family protein [Candidatus Bathyarchaeia archaeon]
MIKTVWCVTFYVSDLKRAAKFYEETLGLEKKYEYSSYVGFECGGVEIGLIPKLTEGQKVSPLSPSVEFLADDVEKVYNKLKNKGVKFIKELHDEPWGGRQATFTDPDGNILEIAQISWEKYFSVSAKGAKKKS